MGEELDKAERWKQIYWLGLKSRLKLVELEQSNENSSRCLL